MTAGWLHVQLYFGRCASAPPVPVGPALGRGAAGPASRSALSPFLCSARELDKVRQQLQEEVRQVSAQLLEERKKRETHEALARRLQKRVLLLTKVGARPAPAHGLPGWLCPASHVVGQAWLPLSSRPRGRSGPLPFRAHFSPVASPCFQSVRRKSWLRSGAAPALEVGSWRFTGAVCSPSCRDGSGPHLDVSRPPSPAQHEAAEDQESQGLWTHCLGSGPVSPEPQLPHLQHRVAGTAKLLTQ